MRNGPTRSMSFASVASDARRCAIATSVSNENPFVLLIDNVASRRASAHAHRFDVIPVGIDEKRRVVGWTVVGAKARRAVVLAAGLDTRLVEAVDSAAILRCERDMRARTLATAFVEPQRRRAFRAESAAVANESERRERGFVEADAGIDVLHLQTDMVVHETSLVGEVTLRRDGEPILENLAIAARRLPKSPRRDTRRAPKRA